MCSKFDISLPLALVGIAFVTMALRDKYASRLEAALKGREFRSGDAIVLSVAIGTMVSIVAVVPKQALLALFLAAYLLLLLQFSYLARPKWNTSVLPPAAFLALYFLLQGSAYWNPLFLDIFAALFAALVSTFLSVMFTWATALVFAAAITAVDVVQVLFTGAMARAFERTIALNLPVALLVPVIPLVPAAEPPYPYFPYAFVGLGLGDLALLGLLVSKSSERYGKAFGLFSTLTVGLAFFIFETLAMNFGGSYYPATVFVISGWAFSLLGRVVIISTCSGRGGSADQSNPPIHQEDAPWYNASNNLISPYVAFSIDRGYLI